MKYEGKDLTFEVPDEWEDRSVVVFAKPGTRTDPAAPNIVVTKDKMNDGENLAKYANRQLSELAKRLHGFRLQEQRDTDIGGQAAKELVFNWLGGRGRIVQRLAMIPQGKQMISITTTVPGANASTMEPVFDEIMASMSFSPPPETKPEGAAPAVALAAGTAGSIPPPSLSAVPPPLPKRSVPPPSGASVPPPASLGAPLVPSSGAASGAASRPPPSLKSPRSSKGSTHQMTAAPSVIDASGRARAAAGNHWQKAATELTARDLIQYVPWACRHEILFVTDNGDHAMVVASGAGEPLLFADRTRVSELNAFFRNETIALPRGLHATDLAQAIRTLLGGPDAWVGSPAFYERESRSYDRWMGRQGPTAEAAFRTHCEGAVLNANGDAWTLLFSSFAPATPVERWEVAGEGNRIRSVTVTSANDKPTG